MPDICKRPFCDKCLIYHNGRCIPDHGIGWCYSCSSFHGEFEKGDELMKMFQELETFRFAKPEPSPEPESEIETEEDDLEDDDQEDEDED